MPSCMLTAILILASTICVAHASLVSFFPPTASQCSNFTVDFTGNQIFFPITFLLLPVNSSSPLVVQLPDTAFDSVSNSGTYTTPIPFSAGTQFIAVVHDARGAGNGGVSTVYTVEGSSNADCLQQGLNNTLAFRLSPSSPPQCELQRISWTPLDPNGNGDNLNNVNITGYVPGGVAFKLNVVRDGVSTGNNTLWQTSVPQGQAFMFLYERTDPATGTVRRETSAIQNVQPSTNSSCTQGGPSVTAPPSTSNSAAQTTQSPGLVSPGSAPNNDKGPFKLPQSALIGIIVGGICLILVLIPLLYLFCTRKHRKRKLSPLEDDQQTTMSDGSRAALMKIDPNAPMGISLPPVRASGFGIDPFSSRYGPTAPTPLPQGERGLSPDISVQRSLFGRMKGRQDNGKVSSVASWGNKGFLTQSILELRPEPKSVPVDVMSDISEYSIRDSVPAPPPPAAIAMGRGGSGPGRQRMPVEGYYPWSDSHGGVAQSSSSEGWDSGNPPGARDPGQARDSLTSEYSPTDPSYDQFLMSPVAGRAPNQYYYPVPPSRANPLVQRRLSAYEGDDDYYEDSIERTRTGGAVFRLEPAGQAL